MTCSDTPCGCQGAGVILSAAKELSPGRAQILRCAQDDSSASVNAYGDTPCGCQGTDAAQGCSSFKWVRSHPHIHMRAIIITEHGVAPVEFQIAVDIACQPEHHSRTGWKAQGIVPVIERAGASYAEEPGSTIVVDSVGQKLVTR